MVCHSLLQWTRQSAGGCDGAQSMAVRSYPTSEARGGSQEKQPHVQGVVTAYEQEGLEELFHVQGRVGSGEEITPLPR